MKSAAEIDQMITELESLRVKYEARKQEATSAHDLVEAKEKEILAELEAQKLTSFKGNKGTVTVSSRFTVKMPKDLDTKEQLRAALGDQEFMALWSINHQSLNSWFKQRLEEAKQKGEYLDLPGLMPTEDKIISFRRASK